MKSSRNENVHVTLGKYLKIRKYSEGDTFKKNDLKIQQSLDEMTFSGFVDVATTAKNAISFSSISGDATAIDQQFSRLKAFISEASEPFKSELTYLMFPMFVHLYLELITNGQKTAAQKFHSRHINLFNDSEEFLQTVQHLGEILTVQDINNHEKIKDFRENKYAITFTDDCYEYLLRFLRNIEHLTLLQLLNLCFDVEILHQDLSSPESPRIADPNPTESTEPTPMECDRLAPVLESQDKSQPTDGLTIKQEVMEDKSEPVMLPTLSSKEATLLALKEAIRKVRDSAPCLPSICLCTLENPSQGLSSACLSHDENLLAVGMEDSSVRLWSLTPDLLYSYKTPVNVSHIRLACDHNVESLEEMDDCKPSSKGEEGKIMRGHSGPVYGLDFVPNCDVLLSCSQDTTVRAWSLKTHTNVALYRGHTHPVFDIAVCPQGLYFATASSDTTARIWTLDRIYPLRILAGHNMDVDCVRFHPNCNYIATGSSDRSVRLWSVQDGRLVRLFQGHRASVMAIAFSPNGKLLASAGEDRRIKIWDIASGSTLKELRGHSDTIYSLCFSRDNSLLASSGLEHSLKLWDMVRSFLPNATSPTNGVAGSESNTSSELLASYPTKSVPVPYLKYSSRNLLYAVGVNSCIE